MGLLRWDCCGEAAQVPAQVALVQGPCSGGAAQVALAQGPCSGGAAQVALVQGPCSGGAAVAISRFFRDFFTIFPDFFAIFRHPYLALRWSPTLRIRCHQHYGGLPLDPRTRPASRGSNSINKRVAFSLHDEAFDPKDEKKACILTDFLC